MICLNNEFHINLFILRWLGWSETALPPSQNKRNLIYLENTLEIKKKYINDKLQHWLPDKKPTALNLTIITTHIPTVRLG